jgi:hypothetical protein
MLGLHVLWFKLLILGWNIDIHDFLDEAHLGKQARLNVK